VALAIRLLRIESESERSVHIENFKDLLAHDIEALGRRETQHDRLKDFYAALEFARNSFQLWIACQGENRSLVARQNYYVLIVCGHGEETSLATVDFLRC